MNFVELGMGILYVIAAVTVVSAACKAADMLKDWWESRNNDRVSIARLNWRKHIGEQR